MRRRNINYVRVEFEVSYTIRNSSKISKFKYSEDLPIVGDTIEEARECEKKANCRFIKKLKEKYDIKPTWGFRVTSFEVLKNLGKTNYDI